MSESLRIAPNAALDDLDDELGAIPEPLPVREGDVIAGKYRIEQLIGIGGMAAVLRATHLQLDQRVAIKLLRPEQVLRPDAVKRFLREARAVVRLKSSNVARVLDVGTAELGPGMHAPFMVMELLEGSDFESIVEAQGPFPFQEAVEHILQACDAVGEAHALGIIHRDLKPANLFLTTRRDGSPLVKLLDFGISKSRHRAPADSQKITQEHAMMGSPAYMSPEQVRSSKDVDERADIWSLGAILYELLTGREPWNGETSADTFVQILNAPTPPIRVFSPDVPPALEAVVLRCLEKDRAARWQTVGELANALSMFVARRPSSVAPTWEATGSSASGVHSSQRLRALDSQRLLAPAWPAPASSSGSAITPPPPRSHPPGRVSMAAAVATSAAPWWRLPALLGAAVAILALIGVVLFVAARARLEASSAATSAASAMAGTRSSESAAAAAAITAEAKPEPPAAAIGEPALEPSASAAGIASPHASARPVVTPPRGAPQPKPAAPSTTALPRHRTDW